jgi:beta-lactamase class A
MSQPEKFDYQRPYYYSSNGRGHDDGRQNLPPKSRKKRHLVRWFFSLVVLVAIGLVAFSQTSNKQDGHNGSVVALKPSKKSSQSSGLSETSLGTMAQTINSVISQNSNITMSVNLIDLNGSQAEHYGVNQTFQAASTAKIITAEDFLHEVEVGKQSLNETINGDTAEYELQQMIVISDDTAWAALDDTLGYSNLQDYADSTFGISDYQAYNNSLSSKDIALALQGLWQGKLLNSSDSQLLLSYLKQANYRQYIVPAVPANDIIYHKIGLYEDYVNDAAIITHGNKAFVIVIFTNGNGLYNWPARATMMQTIAKAALKAYFNQ